MSKVRTQSELDEALARGDGDIDIVGDGRFEIGHSATVLARDSATVHACDSARVRAWDFATVYAHDTATVDAYGSATVRACDSARVRARDFATVYAYGSATVSAWGSATVLACGSVAVQDHGPRTKVDGGRVIKIPEIKDAETWCDYHGVEVEDGVATLYKSVRADFTNGRDGSFSWEPGTIPEAPDWDGGVSECGGGLHMSPSPFHAEAFYDEPDLRYVACPVRVEDIVVHPNGDYPEKVKAPRCCAPIWEVDIDGNPVEDDDE